MGPLAGVHVVEFAGVGPGPMAGMLLADLGATIIRIDRLEPSNLGVPFDTRFDIHARGRRSIALDLSKQQSSEVVFRLLERADILIEGFRPGVMERLGYGPDEVLARHPRIIYGRVTGYGQTGPMARVAGHDLNYISLSGALEAIGPKGGKPLPPLNLVGDYAAGSLYLVTGVLAALVERASSGQGQVVDAAIVDGAVSLMSVFYGLRAAGAWGLERGDNYLDGGAPFYDTYETIDNRFMAVATIEPKFFRQLGEKIGLAPDLVASQLDRSRWPEIRAAMTSIFKSRTQDEWSDLLANSDCCVTPVLTMDEARDHHHLRSRKLFDEIGGVSQPVTCPRFSRSSSSPGAIPIVGGDTFDILDDLGFDDGQIACFRDAGAIADDMR
ncbi:MULTISPECIES: CaiB/BaiF CoA transferase family protein [Sphingobium]|uniref:CaiB/BaiF CoA transferase family protein n=1 Tax=Sphingobium sp. MI1205 TaxID=407020 RepID=UPI0007704BBA|nr:CaiB/BaiF CoA-transferase family protein [Sphingobium sp. MI1205]AMK19590.1 L-carnitine dehydratase/bile acid-inducible protein F [Sphingobium sp. MI1205]